MLKEAIEAKARELRGRYTYRELARDSDTHFTTIDKVIRGERRPSPEVLTAWSRALDPYLPLDEALLAAGHPPTDPKKLNLLQRLARLGDPGWEQLGHLITRIERDEHPNTDAEDESPDGNPGDDKLSTAVVIGRHHRYPSPSLGR